jgi:hypothetical protein
MAKPPKLASGFPPPLAGEGQGGGAGVAGVSAQCAALSPALSRKRERETFHDVELRRRRHG